MTGEWGLACIFLLPAVAAAVIVVCHIAVSRIWPSLGLYVAQLVGVGVGLSVFIALSALMWEVPDSIDRSLANTGVFLCFCFSYFHFNNMGETARRIRLLLEMTSASAPLTYAEIVERYGGPEVLERRLSRLLGAHQIKEVNGRLFIANRTVYWMAWTINLGHRLVFGVRRVNPVSSR